MIYEVMNAKFCFIERERIEIMRGTYLSQSTFYGFIQVLFYFFTSNSLIFLYIIKQLSSVTIRNIIAPTVNAGSIEV